MDGEVEVALGPVARIPAELTTPHFAPSDRRYVEFFLARKSNGHAE